MSTLKHVVSEQSGLLRLVQGSLILAGFLISLGYTPVWAGDLYVPSGYSTIQAAINAANPSGGDTIHVAAGTYAESISINRPVILLGAQASVNPNMDGTGTVTARTGNGGESTISSTYAVVITSSGVTFNGFEVTGFRFAINIPGPFPGPEYKRQNITISYNWLHSTASSVRVGINAEPGLLQNLTIDHNVIDVSAGGPTETALAAVGFSSGQSVGNQPTYENVMLSNNIIKGHADGYGLFSGAEPSLYRINGMTITGNYFYNAGVLYNIGNIANGEFSHNLVGYPAGTIGINPGSVHGNTFYQGGNFRLWGTEYGFWLPSGNLTVMNNNFTDEYISTLPYTGRGFTARVGVNSSTINVNTNAFRTGITPPNVDPNVNPTGYLVWNNGSGTLDATQNWWDSTSGPSGNPGGIYGSVTTTPYISTAPTETPYGKPTNWPLTVLNYTKDRETGFWPVKTTILTFDGQFIDVDGGTTTLTATLSGSAECIVAGRAVTFSWTNPLTNQTTTQTTTSDSSGIASITVTLTAGVVYDITVSVAADSCPAAQDEGTSLVADPTAASTGGGWYKVSGAAPPRVNFGYTVKVKTDKRTGINTFLGQLLWINTSRNRLKSTTITSYGRIACPTLTYVACATMTGSGLLYDWDNSTTTWINERTVTFTAIMYDANTPTASTKKGGAPKTGNPDAFGLQVDGTTLQAESIPIVLSGGQVTVK